jgi:hypothetical protein
MWHAGGSNDCVSCGPKTALPDGFDASMPEGGLSVYGWARPILVEVVKPRRPAASIKSWTSSAAVASDSPAKTKRTSVLKGVTVAVLAIG